MPKENSKVLKERERELPLGERRISHFFVLLMDQVWLCFQVVTFIPREKEGKKKRGNRSFRTEWHLVWSTYISDEKPVKDMCMIEYIWYIYIHIFVYLPVLHYVYIYIYIMLAYPSTWLQKHPKWATFFHGKGRSFSWESNLPFKKLQPPSSGTFHSSSTN